MKKLAFICLLVFICSLSTQAKLPEFDFSDYSAPEYTLKSLTVKFQPLLNFASRKFSENSIENNQRYWDSNISADYSIEFNRDNWEAYVGIFEDFDYSKSVIDSVTQSRMISKHFINGSLKYYLSGKFFTYTEANLSYKHYNYKDDPDYHRHLFDTTGMAGIGYGKMEYISFMRRALYIVDELYENAIIETYPQKQVLVKLGRLLAELDNTRVYDTRLKRIEDFKKIDNFLKENGLLKNDSIEYFTILTDMMLYASVYYRVNGWETGCYYHYDYNHDYMSDDVISETTNTNGLIAFINYSKTINRYWQLDLSAAYTTQDSTVEEDSEKKIVNDLHLRSRLSWYPNSRTLIFGNLYYTHFDFKNELNGIDIEDEKSNAFELYISANYYISPRFKVNGSARHLHYFRDNDLSDIEKTEDTTTFSVSLSYDIF